MGPGMLGGLFGGAAGAAKGLGKLRNIGAPVAPANPLGPVKSLQPQQAANLRLGAQQAAGYADMSPLELRQEVQKSLLQPAPMLANAMQAGWKPTAMQSMALPRQARQQLNSMGYNMPGAGNVLAPIAMGAIGGMLAGNALGGGSSSASKLERDSNGNVNYIPG